MGGVGGVGGAGGSVHVLARGVPPPWQPAAHWGHAGDRPSPAPCLSNYGAPGAAMTATEQGRGSHVGPPMGSCSRAGSPGNQGAGAAETVAPGWLPAAGEQALPRGRVG